MLSFSDAISGWARWAVAHPEFGSSVNLIPTKGGRLCLAYHITDCPPGFENLTASLSFKNFNIWSTYLRELFREYLRMYILNNGSILVHKSQVIYFFIFNSLMLPKPR